MALEAKDITDALAQRQQAQKVLDVWSGTQQGYSDWKTRQTDIDEAYRNFSTVLWPDESQSVGGWSIPNLVQLAVEDRARLVAAGNPSIVKRPSRSGDLAKRSAETIERILAGYWERDKVRRKIPALAMDAMGSGVCAVKVLPDLTSLKDEGRSSVYPCYSRLDPRTLYPDPIFASGPAIDNCIVSSIQKVRMVEAKYKVDLSSITKKDHYANDDDIRVIEFYGSDEFGILAQAVKANGAGKNQGAGWTWLVEPVKHRLKINGKDACPVAIGTRPTLDGVYRGDFDSVIPIMNTWNRLMKMHLDAAAQRVYPATRSWDIENPQEWGPDAHLIMESKDAVFEFIQAPGAAYENHQLMKLQSDFARAASILPEARSGDPSQSIISAAGVGAVNGMESDHVRSLQRDTIAPMLERANELALCADEMWGDVDKEISGYSRGQAFTEKYKPSKDIAGDYRNQVTYGIYGGLDEINQNVMLLQNAGKMMSFRAAREQSPLIEDPLREEKQLALENLDQSILAGIYAAAQAPPGQPGGMDPQTIAALRKALADDDLSLSDAVAQLPVAPPLQPPPALGTPSGVPGIPGAAAQQTPAPFSGPPLSDVLAGPRP